MTASSFARVVLVFGPLAMLACNDADRLSERRGTAEADNREPVVIGYSALRISLPVFVAKERGIFRRHGLDVTLRRYETAQPLVEEVLDGRVAAGGYAALPIIMTAVARGGDAPRVATMLLEDDAHPISRLLRRRGDTSIVSVSDLRGKRIGILPTIAYRKWLGLLLRSAGVSFTDVVVTPLAPPQQAFALAEGGVDALFTNDPMATAILTSEVGELFGPPAPVPAAIGQDVAFGTFLIGAELARERPVVAQRIVEALDEAILAIEMDQRGARAAIAPYTRPEERALIAAYPEARYVTSRRWSDRDLQRAAEIMERHGITDSPTNVEGWVLASTVPVP